MESPIEKMIKDSMAFLIDNVGFEKIDALESMKEYIASIGKLSGSIEKSIETRDFSSISGAAHSMKGSAGNVRLGQLAEYAIKLEQAAKEKDLEECKNAYTVLSQLIIELAQISLE